MSTITQILLKRLILLSLLLAGCGQNASISQGPRILAYGDSVTYGAFTNHVSYVNNIASKLDIPFQNKAVSGTAMMSPNQYPLMMSDIWYKTDIIIFTPGANDSSLSTNQDYLNEYASALQGIVQKAISIGSTLYIGTPLTPLNDSAGWSAPAVEVFANLNRQAVTNANNSNVVLIDFNLEYIPSTQDDADTYHPNSLGYDQMTQIFLEAM